MRPLTALRSMFGSTGRPRTADDVAAPLPETPDVHDDRSEVIASGFRAVAAFALRLLLIMAALAAVLWLVGKLWVGVLPLLLALILTTVLQPVSRFLRRFMPEGLAALTTVIGALVVLLGVLTAIAPSLVDQSTQMADRAVTGIEEVQTWASGPPLNIQDQQVDQAITQLTQRIQEASGDIAGGVFTGVSAVASAFVTALMTLVLTFFFVRDGERFLPWISRLSGRSAAPHFQALGTRLWRTLGGYVRGQAIISAVDAVLIGIALVLLGVPMAGALIILTFLGGFIPIVGAVAVGILSILVALVSVGFTKALILLAVVLFVQNVEGNILQPIVQGKAMEMHEGLVLLSVTVGGSLFGIPGAFLAVPVAASVVVILRYLNEQVDARSGADPQTQARERELEKQGKPHGHHQPEPDDTDGPDTGGPDRPEGDGDRSDHPGDDAERSGGPGPATGGAHPAGA
ncbi:AI-2E family transporter [Kytococcus sp. CUA-901]|nr:AI-2E family transporter [Kytococcus sp. CUA-901]